MEATNGYNHEEWDTYYEWEPELAAFHQQAQDEQDLMLMHISERYICASVLFGKLIKIESLDRLCDIQSGLTDFDDSMHFLGQIDIYRVVAEPRAWRHQTAIDQLLVDLCSQLEVLVYIVDSAFEFSPVHAEQMILNDYVKWRWSLCRVMVDELKLRVDDLAMNFQHWARVTPGEYADIFPANPLDQEKETKASEAPQVERLTQIGAVAFN
ncbi:hypothetical protein AnigIFM50267_000596 [Aspergillus niger]|nr:hypothetical protein AnigIFM50267_000596 [Aspergillus niger]